MKYAGYYMAALVLILLVGVVYFWDYLKNKFQNAGKPEKEKTVPEPSSSFTSGALPDPKAFLPDTKVIVTASRLNLRSGAGTDKPIVGSTVKGEYWWVIGSKDGWLRISDQRPMAAMAIQAADSYYVPVYGAKDVWAYSAYFNQSSFNSGGGGSF